MLIYFFVIKIVVFPWRYARYVDIIFQVSHNGKKVNSLSYTFLLGFWNLCLKNNVILQGLATLYVDAVLPYKHTLQLLSSG
jgi:hypothetical protein